MPPRSAGSSITVLTSRTLTSVRECEAQAPSRRMVTVVFGLTVAMVLSCQVVVIITGAWSLVPTSASTVQLVARAAIDLDAKT